MENFFLSTSIPGLSFIPKTDISADAVTKTAKIPPTQANPLVEKVCTSDSPKKSGIITAIKIASIDNDILQDIMEVLSS
ncbi:MAG: hypothetical protein BWX72_01747 [Firmicutes bacterium ADurb.Bin080]|nr:MAG: hypothetical protein BWX72_01747 [Firmicutes bacterium ADurb.Bin080]